MTTSISYTKFENEVKHLYRDQLNHAESVEDVKKFFVYTTTELMERVFDHQLTLRYEDIALTPSEEPYFTLDDRLRSDKEFSEKWQDSDLKFILARLANSACNRYRHLERNPAKTNSKIMRH